MVRLHLRLQRISNINTRDDCMEDILKQVIDKISSYNILNYLYPGILFCYLLGALFDRDVLSDNWVGNCVILLVWF